MLYQTTKCPACGYVLERNKPTGINAWWEWIGNPIAVCPNCRGPYRTGKEYWRNMGTWKRFGIRIVMIFSTGYSAVFYSLMPVLGFYALCELGGWEPGGGILAGVYLVSLPILMVACTRNARKMFRELTSLQPPTNIREVVESLTRS